MTKCWQVKDTIEHYEQAGLVGLLIMYLITFWFEVIIYLSQVYLLMHSQYNVH
jgi:hypothetical protein